MLFLEKIPEFSGIARQQCSLGVHFSMANKLKLSMVMLRLIKFHDADLDEESSIACWLYAIKSSGWILEEFVMQVILHELSHPLDYYLLAYKV